MKRIFALLVFLPLFLAADTPWIDIVYVPQLYLEGGTQLFPHYNQGVCLHHNEVDGFCQGKIDFATSPTFSVEGALAVTRSHKHPWVIDHFQEAFKKVVLDDVAGDPIALASGVSFTQVPTVALHDPAFLHRAHFETEVFVSLGKEWDFPIKSFNDLTQAYFWDMRLWGGGVHLAVEIQAPPG